MPYNPKNIATNKNCLRISLSYLFKNKYIEKNKIKTLILEWDIRGDITAKIKMHTCFTESEKYVTLCYSITNKTTNEQKDFNYNINLIPVKSNLGLGNIYYFQCPETFRKCRFLYKAYNSDIFKSRYAYSKRIYYLNQTISNVLYPLKRLLQIQEVIRKMENTRMKTVYRGRETSTYKRYSRLKEELNKYQKKNLQNVVLRIIKGVGG